MTNEATVRELRIAAEMAAARHGVLPVNTVPHPAPAKVLRVVIAILWVFATVGISFSGVSLVAILFGHR